MGRPACLIWADAVEKGFNSIVVSLDEVFDGLPRGGQAALRWMPPPVPTLPTLTQASVPVAARGFGARVS